MRRPRLILPMPLVHLSCFGTSAVDTPASAVGVESSRMVARVPARRAGQHLSSPQPRLPKQQLRNFGCWCTVAVHDGPAPVRDRADPEARHLRARPVTADVTEARAPERRAWLLNEHSIGVTSPRWRPTVTTESVGGMTTRRGPRKHGLRASTPGTRPAAEPGSGAEHGVTGGMRVVSWRVEASGRGGAGLVACGSAQLRAIRELPHHDGLSAWSSSASDAASVLVARARHE